MIDQGDKSKQKKENSPTLAVNPPPPMEKKSSMEETPSIEEKAAAPKEEQPEVKDENTFVTKKSGGKEITRIARLRDGTNVVRDKKGVYYTISVDAEVAFVRNTASVPAKQLETCFNWHDIIDEMLPTREEMIDNVQSSILRAGGIQPGAGNPNRYLALAFNMYKLEFEEK